jgi:hypothetical protein
VLQRVIQGTGPEPTDAAAARLERPAAFGKPWVFGIRAGGTPAFGERHGLQLVSDRNVAELFPLTSAGKSPANFGRVPRHSGGPWRGFRAELVRREPFGLLSSTRCVLRDEPTPLLSIVGWRGEIEVILCSR